MHGPLKSGSDQFSVFQPRRTAGPSSVQDWGHIHTDTSMSLVSCVRHYTGYSNHKLTCIPTTAVHSNMGDVFEYELPW